MTPQETKEYLDKMKKFAKELRRNSKRSKRFLQETGIYTKKGNLTSNYK